MRTSRIEQVGRDVDICDMLGQIGGCLGWAGKKYEYIWDRKK